MDRHILGAAAMLALAGAPAAAAPPAAYNWTGFYIGANAGYSWGSTDSSFTGSGADNTVFGAPIVIPNSIPFASASQSQALNGFIGGGQLGYNYQVLPNLVLGFEADIQGADQRGTNAVALPSSGSVCTVIFFQPTTRCGGTVPFIGGAAIASDAKIEWFGTLRGRVGLPISAANGAVMIYGTGGLAYGRVSVSGTSTVSGSAFPFGNFATATNSFDASRTNIGFAVGGGLEGGFSTWLPPNWSWKLEYLYVDLGSLDTATAFTAASLRPAVFSDVVGITTTHTRFTDKIVRVGVNYRFGP